jgi:hypothetical protein
MTGFGPAIARQSRKRVDRARHPQLSRSPWPAQTAAKTPRGGTDRAAVQPLGSVGLQRRHRAATSAPRHPNWMLARSGSGFFTLPRAPPRTPRERDRTDCHTRRLHSLSAGLLDEAFGAKASFQDCGDSWRLLFCPLLAGRGTLLKHRWQRGNRFLPQV